MTTHVETGSYQEARPEIAGHVTAETTGHITSERAARRRRIARFGVRGAIAGLTITSIVIPRIVARAQQRASGRRRGGRISIQPRVAIFAPTITISLPFSGIAGQTSPGRGGRSRRRGAAMTWRGGGRSRRAAARSQWRQRMRQAQRRARSHS